MSVITRARFWLAKVFGSAATNISFVPDWIRHSFFVPAFRLLVKDGYKANSAVSACVQVLALAFQEPPLMTWQEGADDKLQPMPNHPFRQLVEMPNADMGEAEFMQYVITYCSIGGNAYVWKQRSTMGQVVCLWVFHDGQVTPIPGKDSLEGLVAYYVYDDGSGFTSNPFGVERRDSIPGIAIPKNDIIHWKWAIDPAQPWRGIGAIALAARDVGIDNEIANYIFSLLKNDATPPLVITLVEGDEVTDDRVRRITDQWRQKYGFSNRGTPAVLESGMSVERIALDLGDLAFETLSQIPESRISASFRVPAIIAGLNVGLQRSTFSNFAEARRSFTTNTLIPLWRGFASEVQKSMADEPGFGDTILAFDLSKVGSLQEDENELWARVGSAWMDGRITKNEARAFMRLDETPAGDVFMESLTTLLTPVGEIREPVELAPPADTDQQEESEEGSEEESGDGEEEEKRVLSNITKQRRRISRDERRRAQQAVDAQRSIRLRLAGRMEAEVDRFFIRLRNDVEDRARALKNTNTSGNGSVAVMVKQLPTVTELTTRRDFDELEDINRRFFLSMMRDSNNIMNLILGTNIQFDENDPLVTEVLAMAGENIGGISATTRQAVSDVLQTGNELGWSIDMLIAGEPTEGIRGLGSIIEETFRNRAMTIARTELGNAQNAAAVDRFQRAGVTEVLVFDNGLTDDDQPCIDANGSIWSLERARSNPLQHPNCTRAFAPLL